LANDEERKDEKKSLEDLKLPLTPEKDKEEIEELKPIEEIECEPTQKQTSSGWTPEAIQNFLSVILGENLADKLLTLKKNDAEAQRTYFETVSSHNRRMIYVLMGFLIGIVGFMSLLTLTGSVSGDALLFLVGTITGYILLFIQRLVFPSEEKPKQEEESLF